MKNLCIGSSVVRAAALLAVLSLDPVTAHGQGRFPQQLTLYDRAGNVVRILGDPADYNPASPVFSPDGTRLAIAKRRGADPAWVGSGDIWGFDLSTGASTRITSGSGVTWQAAWSPDGSQVAFVARRDGFAGLYRIASSGAGGEELLYRHTQGAGIHGSIDWSQDGRFLCFESGAVLFVLPLNGDRKAVELVREEYQVGGCRFSPDGRFLAYKSDESGRDEIYVRAFDPSTGTFSSDGGKWQVSDQGGSGVLWSRNGGGLHYISRDGGLMPAVMAVEVTTTPTFKAGPPKLLFRAPIFNTNSGTISRDSQRFAFYVAAPPPDRLTPPERTTITVSRGILARYVGTYSLGPFVEDDDAVVTLEGNQLMIRAGLSGQMRPLSAESETHFFLRDPTGDTNFEFVKDAKGVVTNLIRNGVTKWTRK